MAKTIQELLDIQVEKKLDKDCEDAVKHLLANPLISKMNLGRLIEKLRTESHIKYTADYRIKNILMDHFRDQYREIENENFIKAKTEK